MESLSRPPLRREHSTTTNTSPSSSSFSFRNPYDDVLFSKGGKVKFEAHEYAEIFSGSSSIPVLDLSSLNGPVRPGNFRSSKLDYSNIFGEFRDDDSVALPYEQLFNGSPKKTKTRIQSDMDQPFNKQGSINSSVKTQRSAGASEQSTNGFKQQFNISFNKTSQRRSDESNGEIHIAQLHAVPGFTHFVDGTPLQNKEHERSKPSMKREVSRAWSFSSGIEPITVKGGIAVEKSHTPEKSCNVIGINPKMHTLKGFSPSSPTSSPNDSKDLRQSGLPSLASKDASRKSAGEYSPLLFDEELDENSVAAVSIAALRKAIEQAQESIRIAKMIMEKRKEGLKDGSKSRSKSHLKVKDKKESRIHSVPDASKVKNEKGTYEQLDPPNCNDNFPNAGMVRENVEVANDHAVTDVGKRSAPSCSQREIPKTDGTIGLENVEPAETCGETINFTGLTADAIHGTVTFESGKVDTCIMQMETGKETLEHRELAVDQPRRPEVVSETVESDPKTSQSVKELEKCVDEAFRQCLATFDHMGPKLFAENWETVLECSEVIQEEKIMHEGGGNLRISLEDDLTEENGSLFDNKEKCEKNFVRHEKLDRVEQLAGLKSEFDNLQNDSRSLPQKDVMKQADLNKKPENFCELKENKQIEKTSEGQENGTVLEEEHHWFESELQLTEPVEEEDISLMEPEIYQEADPGIKENLVQEMENVDKKLNRKHGQNRHMDSSDCETLQMETDKYPEFLKVEDKIGFMEATIKDIDEAITAHCNDLGTIFSETHEPCDGDLNYRKEHQAAVRGCKENNCSPLENVTILGDEDNETRRTIHLELDEMPGTDCLYRCSLEEKFVGSQQNNTVAGLSSNSKSDNVDLVDADHEETTFETASEIHDASEIEDKNAKPVLERSPESVKESLLTPIRQNIEMVSTHEAACRGSLEDKTPNKGGKDRLVITSDEREYVEEQSERLHPKDQSGCSSSPSNCEVKEMDKSMESEREVEKGQDMEKKQENPSRTCTIGQKDVQGNDHEDRIEAIKRGRKLEKDRMAVERAIREARERAFAEARHRAMAEAREKLERASVENKNPVDKVSNEVKLRAERAAVERATAEARERALEKAMSQKTYTEARTQAEKFSTERFSTSRNNGLKHSLSSSGSEKFDGPASESAQRRKARLERHQRIMERAAKALAEKNTRDLLTQKEQAERNRLAESLDSDIKRWATGKEGNLRALLSTLHYILGAESGWQAVPLTEMLTTGAVKKAYRKATLCVHPDKLQQRGATIHQKYICEKVFDLLKAAWNRFNSEER